VSVYLSMIGERYGRVVVLEVGEIDGPRTKVRIRCDCGTDKEVYACNLRAGHTQSCGCLHKERTSAARLTHGHTPVGTDGKQRMSKEYKAWSHMIQRCYNQNDERYPAYGGRGITVCDRWRHDFSLFYADVGAAPSPSHSLDRRRVNGDYEPSNCRWATPQQQAENRQDTVRLRFRYRMQPLTRLARRFGIPVEVLRVRVARLGWSVERALTTSVRRGE
jgi:hypothetical protein